MYTLQATYNVQRTTYNVQRTTYNVQRTKEFLKISKITTWLLMLSILFSSNYLYSQGNNWKLDGNNNVGSNTFLGSTNNAPLNLRTNNLNRLTISSSGNFTFHTLNGTGSALMLLNNNGESYRLNFSQNNNDSINR
ncbi:MAG: hypothetical protein KatS3mg027_2562 [Bacteroidia bacterium]|nr:MAG: hypothetical protein KatS3mg027_2562 [Bacteroidia bacterium]